MWTAHRSTAEGAMSELPCGCCEPPARPPRVENRPALPAIVYRVGTYASFRQAMLDQIAGAEGLGWRLDPATLLNVPLLTTRRSDDYSITTLELWAAVADVLTFYQERYANEVYLRTAVFLDSVTRLAALIDYRPRPGVAARARVAFTLEAGARLTIPIGQKVQSVPGQNETPQTFETVEVLEADARLNRLRIQGAPVAGNPLAQNATASTLDRLRGPALGAALSPGTAVVIFNDGSANAVEEKKVTSVRSVDDVTTVEWNAAIQKNTWTAASRVHRFRRTLRLFGHNAPETYMAPSVVAGRITWNLVTLAGASFQVAAGATLALDGRHEQIAVGQQLLVADAAAAGVKTRVTVQAVAQVKKKLGSLEDTVTQLTVSPNLPALGDLRQVLVYELDGEPLTFWAAAYPATVTGEAVYLPGVRADDAAGPAVEVGRTVERGGFKAGVVLRPDDVARGRVLLLMDDAGAVVRATIAGPPSLEPPGAVGAFAHLRIPVTPDAPLSLDAASAVLLGNVAEATHGETVAGEVVGNGDASLPFQRFTLRKSPVTYLSGAGPNGTVSSLELRVDRVRWTEVPGLYGQPAGAPVYELRLGEDGRSVVQFGDGVNGAIPPTGAGNVTATYRVGSGLAGRVDGGVLTTLLQKPPGLQSAVNPVAAEGGADGETVDDARGSAPVTVRTFGRAVSLRDFEDLVTESGEVARALATRVWTGGEAVVHLTVAGQDGGTFSEEGRRGLADAMRPQRDPNHRLLIDNYAVVHVRFEAGIGIDPAYERDAVLAAACAAVLDALSFAKTSLGAPVNLSDLYRVVQDVAGVVFVDVDRLAFKTPPGMTNAQFMAWLAARGTTFLPGGQPAPVQGRLRLFPARPHPTLPRKVLPAELAAIQVPGDVVMTAREV
jgi:predicted phage baseplate assembly protein